MRHRIYGCGGFLFLSLILLKGRNCLISPLFLQVLLDARMRHSKPPTVLLAELMLCVASQGSV